MINKHELKKYILDNSDIVPIIYNEEEDAIYNKETNEYISSLDTYLNVYRRHSGESFECICYIDHSLLTVLKCTECGTIILSHDDEDYDPDLKCPTCTGYKTHFEFWTKEDIYIDINKQKKIKYFYEYANYENEINKRMEKRNGKCDWEIAKNKFFIGNKCLFFSLECDDVTKSYIKGLKLKIDIGRKKNKEDIGYTLYKFFIIPLSWSYFCRRRSYKRSKAKNN